MDDLTDEFDLELDLKVKKKKKKQTRIEEVKVSEEDREYTYTELLARLYSQMPPRDTKKFTVPPPHMGKEGRMSVIINFKAIASALNRSMEHLSKFLTEELAAKTSITAKGELRISGKFNDHKIESIIRKYVQKYKMCVQCHGFDTEIIHDAGSRLNMLKCNQCQSSSTIDAIEIKN